MARATGAVRFTADMTPPDEDARARALARADWPVRKHTLASQPGDDLSASTTPTARLAMVDTLTREAWALTGRRMPDYTRAEMPVSLRRLGTIASSDDVDGT